MCRQRWTLRVGAAWVGLLLLAAACASVPDTDSGFISESTFTSPPGGRPIVAPGEREGFRPFYSDQLHARVILPPGWVGVDGPEPLRPALPGMGEFGLGPGIAAFNSWGGGGFWAHAVPVGCCGFQYGGQSVLDQLPEDGAYVVVTDDSATASHAYVEHESSYLTDLWPTSDCRSDDAAGGDNATSSTASDIASDSTFVSPPDSTSDGNAGAKSNVFGSCKWTRCYKVEVYCAPGVSDATAEAVTSLLQSWQFDAFPAGDENWARQQAFRVLPETVASLFSPVTGMGTRWMIPGETMETLFAEIAVEANGFTVIFKNRWNDPTLQTGSRECPEDRCHWWRVEVTPDGQATLTEEGGAPLP